MIEVIGAFLIVVVVALVYWFFQHRDELRARASWRTWQREIEYAKKTGHLRALSDVARLVNIMADDDFVRSYVTGAIACRVIADEIAELRRIYAEPIPADYDGRGLTPSGKCAERVANRFCSNDVLMERVRAAVVAEYAKNAYRRTEE